MQSLGAYGITSTSFTTEIHPSFYILIPILVLALLMALLAPFCLLRAFVRATRHGCLPILDGWVWGREGTMSSLAQHADGFVRPTGHAIQLSKACRHPRLGNATPKRKVCRKVHTSTFHGFTLFSIRGRRDAARARDFGSSPCYNWFLVWRAGLNTP